MIPSDPLTGSNLTDSQDSQAVALSILLGRAQMAAGTLNGQQGSNTEHLSHCGQTRGGCP